MVLSMERWKGKIAVVTGASSGIGAQVVKQLLKEGIIVIGMARRKEKIEELSSCKDLHALKVDVTKEEEVLNAFNWVKDNLGPIHILINSAGTLWFGNLIDGPLHMWRDMFETDVLGLCLTTREAIKDMRANNVSGHVIHVSGVSGHGISVAHASALGACKSAITAATEAVRKELISIGSKIKISVVSPGVVETELLLKTIEKQPEYRSLANSFRTEEHILNTSDVADAILYVLSTPPHVQVHNILIRPVGSLF